MNYFYKNCRIINERNPGNLNMVWFMVFNATFSNISAMSCHSVLLMEDTRVPRENHRPVASLWQTLSHNVVLSTPRNEQDSQWAGFELTTSVVIVTDCIATCKSNYHTITTTMAPIWMWYCCCHKCTVA